MNSWKGMNFCSPVFATPTTLRIHFQLCNLLSIVRALRGRLNGSVEGSRKSAKGLEFIDWQR